MKLNDQLKKKLEFLIKKDENEYLLKSEEYINSLDFKRLEEIKQKDISEISESDLNFLGFDKISHEDFKELYCYRDFNNLKIYFNRLPDKFEILGYQFKKQCDISTVKELFENSLLKWRLRVGMDTIFLR